MPKAQPIEPRFWAAVERGSDDECWPWIGSTHPEGYGRFFARGHYHRAHRFAYELLVGPVPEGLVLDHLCRNPGCVNPAHLEPVTNRENILRGEAPSAKHALKTHCPQGHEYTEANTVVSGGSRECRECKKIKSRERRQIAKLEATVRAQAEVLRDVETWIENYPLNSGAGYAADWQALRDEIRAVLASPEAPAAEPLDTAAILWVAALDRVPIESRTTWVAEMKERVRQINEQRAAALPAVDAPPPELQRAWDILHADGFVAAPVDAPPEPTT